MPVFKTVSPAGLERRLQQVNAKYGTNGSGFPMAIFTVCSWAATGMLQKASALTDNTSTFAGILLQSLVNGETGLVAHSGTVKNSPLLGLNAKPGQPVYLSDLAGEFTLTPPPLTSGTIRIGFAEPADGVTDGSANDLLIEFEFIRQP